MYRGGAGDLRLAVGGADVQKWLATGIQTIELTLSTAVSKIVPGATSLSLRNNADSSDNLLILDSGDVTVRGGVKNSSILTARMTLTGGAQTVANTGEVKVTLDTATASFDPSSWVDISNHRIVVQVAGYYLVAWSAQMTSTSSTAVGLSGGQTYSVLYVSGSAVRYGVNAPNSTAAGIVTNGCDIVQLVVSDYLELFVSQNSSASANVRPLGQLTFLTCRYLGS